MHNLFRHVARWPRLEGYYFKPAHGPRAARRPTAGPHRHHRLPVGRGPDPAAARPVRRGACRRPPSSATSSAPRTSSASSWTTASTSSAASMKDLLRLAKDLACRWSPPTTCTTPSAEDAKAHAALLCVQSGSTLTDPNRFKFDADEFYLKTPGRDARTCSASSPRRATTRCSSPSAARSSFTDGEGQLHAALPLPRGREREVAGSSRRSRRACTSATRAASRTTVRKQADYETGVIVSDGLPRLLPRRRRLHQLGQGQRHPGRSRPWLRRRLDGAPTPCASPTSTRCSTA